MTERTRLRLRPRLTPAQMDKVYSMPHDHRRYGRGHGERVAKTIEVAHQFPFDVLSVADLSCGNAAIARSFPDARLVLGDFAPGYDIMGPIEETILKIDPVDLFILSETLEHLDDPGDLLCEVRDKTDLLVLSTPVDCWDDTNQEHYWAWSREGVEELLTDAGFDVLTYDTVDSRLYQEPYCYGIWSCQ